MAKVEIDNKKMWESILEQMNNSEYDSLRYYQVSKALKDQDLEYKDGEIVSIEPEPKFKVGDWLVAISSGNLFNILSIDDSSYKMLCSDGTEANYPFKDVDYDLRSWTIQDAKDGDVLYSIDSKQPFIYKERPQFSQAIGYCCINKFGEFAIWDTSKCIICTDKYIPATKEQRDILFKAMADAGYQWDAEKKQLTHSEVTNKSDQELTEFENKVNAILWCAVQNKDIMDFDDYTKQWSKELISLARKQIASEIDVEDMVEEKKDSLNLEKDAYFAFGAYRKGIEDTLKAIKQE